MQPKNFVLRAALSLSFFLTSFTSHAANPLICEGAESFDIAWHLNNNQVRTLQANKTEPRNVDVSRAEQKRRIENRVKAYHSGVNGVSTGGIADLVVWAAACTGNDFTYLAGVLETESMYCKNRHNKGGGDSGCGQFTTVALKELKSQMRLPGQQANNNAVREVTETLHNMAKNCFAQAGNSKRYDDFITLFSKSNSDIQKNLRAGQNLDLDILASALYLKFMVALGGGYLVSGQKAGGIARYNGGGDKNYVSKVTGAVQKVDFTCYEDEYTPYVQAISCEMSNEPSRCYAELAGEISI